MRPVTIFLLSSSSPTASAMRPHQLIRQMDRTQVKTGGKMSAMQSSCFTPTILPISSTIFFLCHTNYCKFSSVLIKDVCHTETDRVAWYTRLLFSAVLLSLQICKSCKMSKDCFNNICREEKLSNFRVSVILFNSHQPLQLSLYRQPFFCSIRNN